MAKRIKLDTCTERIDRIEATQMAGERNLFRLYFDDYEADESYFIQLRRMHIYELYHRLKKLVKELDHENI